MPKTTEQEVPICRIAPNCVMSRAVSPENRCD